MLDPGLGDLSSYSSSLEIMKVGSSLRKFNGERVLFETMIGVFSASFFSETFFYQVIGNYLSFLA